MDWRDPVDPKTFCLPVGSWPEEGREDWEEKVERRSRHGVRRLLRPEWVDTQLPCWLRLGWSEPGPEPDDLKSEAWEEILCRELELVPREEKELAAELKPLGLLLSKTGVWQEPPA